MLMDRIFLTLGTIALSVAAPKAIYAATLPNGSYQATCTNMSADGAVVTATCGTGTGISKTTQLRYATCAADVWNANGHLVCVDGRPVGTYEQSCSQITFDGTWLNAACRTTSGSTAGTRIDVPSCTGDIANNNGVLECSGYRSPYDTINWLKGSDFENNTNWKWVTSGNPNASRAFAANAGYVYSGKRSLSIAYKSATAANTYARLYQNVPVNANSAYELVTMVKGTSAGSVYMAVTAGGGTTWPTRQYFPSSGSFDWTPYYVMYDSGGATSLDFMFGFDGGNSSSAVYLDDAIVREIFVRDNSFESGTSWTFNVAGNASGSGQVVSGGRWGSHSYQLSYQGPRLDQTYVDIYQTINTLLPWTNYVIEAWVKGTNIGIASIATDPSWSTRYYLPTGDINDWKKITLNFTTGAPATLANWPLLIIAESSKKKENGSDYYPMSLQVDDVKIYRAIDYYHRQPWVAEVGNALQNPSFENLNISSSDWAVGKGNAGGIGSGSLLSNLSMRGNQSYVINNTDTFGPDKYVSLYQTVSVSPNTRYKLSGYVKGDNVHEACLSFDWGTKAYVPFGTYDWTYVSLDFTTGPSQTTALVQVSAENYVRNLYIDNMRLEKIAKTTTTPYPIVTGDAISGKGANHHWPVWVESYEAMAQTGMKWLRHDFTWWAVEPSAGNYDLTLEDYIVSRAASNGIEIYGLLGSGNALYDHSYDTNGSPIAEHPHTAEGVLGFVNYAKKVITQYKGKGFIFELYNEPNLITAWPGYTKPIDGYIALARAVGQAVRSDPNTSGERLVLPALALVDAGFLTSILESGVMDYYDAISIHPYRGGGPESILADFDFVRGLVSSYYPNRSYPILMGEMGYTTPVAAKGFDVDETTQALYYGRQHMVSLLGKTLINMWYSFVNEYPELLPSQNGYTSEQMHDDYEGSFGLFYNDLTPKPSLAVSTALANRLSGAQSTPSRIAPVANTSDALFDVYVLSFGPSSRWKQLFVVWCTSGNKSITIPATYTGTGNYNVWAQNNTSETPSYTINQSGGVGLNMVAMQGVQYVVLP